MLLHRHAIQSRKLPDDSVPQPLRQAFRGRVLESRDLVQQAMIQALLQFRHRAVDIIEVDNLEEGLEFARELTKANPGGAYELRPIMLYNPGAPVEQR